MKHFIKNGDLSSYLSYYLLSPYFIIEPVRVDGHSMDPTLADGEH